MPAVWLPPAGESAWDGFVAGHPLGLVYHTSAWKQAVETAFPHIRGHFLALEDPGSGKIVAGLPVYRVRSWLLGNRTVSVPFASISDPLVDNHAQLKRLVQAIGDGVGGRRPGPVSIRALKTAALFDGTGLHAAAHHRHHFLQLDRSPAELLASFSKSAVQYEIKRVRKAGFTIVEGHEAKDIELFHGILTATRRRLSLPPLPLRFFTAMRASLGGGRCSLYFAVRDGSVAATLLMLNFKDMAAAEYSGDLRQPGQSGVNQLIYWHAIQEAVRRGCRSFSFGRTAVADEGLLQYKRRWGTVEEDIVTHTDRPGKSRRSRETSLSYRFLRLSLRHLPGPLFTRMGDFVYRHLG